MNKIYLFLFVALLFSSCGGDNIRKVQVQTEYGNMTIELFNTTPQHRDNFVKLVKEGFYDDLLFHRVMQSFMIQGGDPQSKGAAPGARLGTGGPGYTIPAEIQHYHYKGRLSAARQPDSVNPEMASSGSQFYIVQGSPVSSNRLDAMASSKGLSYSEEAKNIYTSVGGRPDLDAAYTVFGQVTEGLDVIDKIAAVQVDQYNRPFQDVKMKIVLLN